MSRHQDVRNLDYQNELDEYEGYSEEEEELSPEDKAQMRQGTDEVRAALGIEASKVTTTQIEEALWHYYYDVDKSVAYLISKFIDPPKKTPKKTDKPVGKFTSHLVISSYSPAYTYSCSSPPAK
jgi:elongation factor 1 alpha-like protein